MKPLKVYPSLLAADLGKLREDCQRCEALGADALHVDLMDGHFVPNMSFSPAVVAMARDAVKIPLNVHLMMTEPHKYVDAFCDAGSDTLLIHIEPDYDHAATLEAIRAKGVRPGIVLNPDTELSAIEPVLDLVDEVLFMTVFPGFGGQSFLPNALPRMQELRAQRPDLDIAVDGGLNRDTCTQCAQHGANIFDVGSYLFKQPDMGEEMNALRALV